MTFNLIKLSLLSMLVLLVVGVKPLPSTAQEQVAKQKPAKWDPPPAVQEIDEVIKEYVKRGRASGAVTLVAHQGKVIHLGAVGMRDISAGKPMHRWSRFAIASMTKPMTATAVMILEDEGKLSVDDPIEKYLPEFKNPKLKDGRELARPLTIRDALTHTSGIVGEQVFQGSLEDHIKEVASRELGFQPGEKWQYGPGVSVAGRVVEVVSGQPFEEFMQERIFTPLRMKNTTFRPDEQGMKNLAVIYRPDEDSDQLVDAGNWISSFSEDDGPNPSGGLVSTAHELFRFYQMILNDGKLGRNRLLSSDAVKKMISPQVGELETGFTPGNTWGLGWCIVKEPQGVTAMVSEGTYGHGGAFGTQGWIDPTTETIFVMLIQRTNMGNSDGSEMRAAFQKAAVEYVKSQKESE
ncbi:MAG: serine hydrolase domain-containing protein [Rubripirellula sp.]